MVNITLIATLSRSCMVVHSITGVLVTSIQWTVCIILSESSLLYYSLKVTLFLSASLQNEHSKNEKKLMQDVHIPRQPSVSHSVQ